MLPKKYQDIFACMENTPYHTGYSVKRWQKVIDVLIMWKEGDYRMNRTMLIPLKEADANENSKRMAKDAADIAENITYLQQINTVSCMDQQYTWPQQKD